MNLNILNEGDILFLDGAMGTMLQKAGLKAGEIPEVLNISSPEIIGEIHRKYIEAGAQVITTNTFGANEFKLSKTQLTVEDVVTKAVNIAKNQSNGIYVALDIGPTGQLLEPMGDLSFEEAYNCFARQVIAGGKAGADLIIIETMSDIYEAKAAVLAAKENSKLPVFCTMTFQENGRTLTGTDALTMVNILQGLGVDALGVNCSMGPEDMMPIIKQITAYSKVPVIVQPNAGLPKLSGTETTYDVNSEQFSLYMKEIVDSGVTIVGGCCGTTPEYIHRTIEALKGLKAKKRDIEPFTAVSSSRRTVILGEKVTIIGERINPTGKKKFKEALRNNDIDYVVDEAIEQKQSGADILDVNVGLPELDERKVMEEVVREIQAVVDLPLQIDSMVPEVIEAAVRIYNGKPIINSVNGKEKTMESIFPIVKKYGAVVIGLTIDENGIPQTAEERVKIAAKIISTASKYGIPKEDIIIDCLVLTASAQQTEVMETAKALRIIKESFGVATTLGVSNVSFGLPKRELLNRTFLSIALAAGLDAPILNPLDEDIMATVHAFNVLSNHDKESKQFIEIYADSEYKTKQEEKKKKSTGDSLSTKKGQEVVSASQLEGQLKEAVIKGLKDKSADMTTELLGKMEPLAIVDNCLIPSLDVIGEKYETGDIFLPQLIQSAETVKNSFDVIKAFTKKENKEGISKGKILLATVKGDVHDIGKNIVKVLLENYGFEVIDMGKDVDEEEIIEMVRKENVKLVGLSALMTTTVRSMEETIKAIRDSKLDCKIIAGGAVLNKEYADMIGADYYAKDAREGVKIAQEFFSI